MEPVGGPSTGATTGSLALRHPSAVPALAAGAAAVVGALAAVQPTLAVALVGGSLVLALPFLAPVTHLLLLVFVTAVVPFDIQNSFAFGGGRGSPGLLLSDVLLLGGLVRSGLLLLDTPLRRRQAVVLGLVLGFLALATLQFLRGVRAGHDPATAGHELRTLLGLAVAFVALPVLQDPAARPRLLKGLLAVGLLLGLWGLAQWTLTLPFNNSDLGVREGIGGTSSGRGQLQGGLFGFPVGVVLGLAALLSTEVRSLSARLALVAVIALNGTSLLLTYERTFWAATLAALGFVALRAAPAQRARALALAPALVAALLAGFALLAPAELTAAQERLTSVGGQESDNSLRYRLLESRHVSEKIDANPLLGSGLGATITWGRPYESVPPHTVAYSHNGYLWAAWKLGIPLAVLLVALLGVLIVWQERRDGSLHSSLRTGAQGALLVLLVVNLLFPSFNALSITPTMGLLAALLIAPRLRPSPPARRAVQAFRV